MDVRLENVFMLFKRPLLNKILKGEKTQTRHPINRKKGIPDYHVSQKVGMRAGYTKFEAYVIITKKFRQKLGDISEEDARKEGFASVEDFKQTWIKLYGSWKPSIVVWVYEFKLVPTEGLASKGMRGQQESGS
jgi:hypothetical protein